jgi:hypothetical protein
MPIPAPDTNWPPAPLVDLLPRFQQWSAWYSGEIDQLTSAYGSDAVSAVINRPIQYAGGLRGWVGRIIWGNPVAEGQQDDRLHVPLAADLCAAAGELCYSDPPQITADSVAAQTRVQEYIAAGLFASAATGLEIGQALGGHYKQAVIPAGGERAILETIAYDGAWPTFSRGRLVEVTFWWELPSVNSEVWRHFESHDVGLDGVGVIRHALFKGTRTKVGQREALTARPETMPLTYPNVLGAGDIYSTGTPGLDVVHTPARNPQRLWRTHPLGMHLGRSVLQGQEPVLSQLDNVYTSWMRDVDLARSRLVVADWLLDQRVGPTGLTQGMGKSFDLDRKLITPLAIPQAIGQDGGMDPIKMVQFAIRVQEHRDTCQELTEIVLRAASFSAQTFGEDENGNAQTATGVLSKDSRSMRTRRAILGPEADGLKYIVEKMLAMDQAAGLGPVAGTVTVTFPEGAEESPLQLAQTLQAVRGAQAASNETIVRMFHPDWTDEQVGAELKKMQADLSASMTFDAGTATSFPPDSGPNPLGA